MNSGSLLPDTGRRTLLIVDDNPDNLTVLAELLLPHYQVLAANSGQRCLNLAGAPQRPDLILLDVMMPGMSGYEVLERLHDNPKTSDIPVIFLTAMDSIQDEEHGLDQGAVDYITKPIRPSILLARVRNQLDLKQARDWLRDQNNLLEAEVDRRLKENQAIQDVGIHALARLAEIRDPETGDHLRRTQNYVRALATHLRTHPRFAAELSDHAIRLITKSAPLHDIGKVGIPDDILLKPGKLNAEEWAVMQTHAYLGAHAIEQAQRDISRPVEYLVTAREIAHWHHEKWDGSGYPDGLKADAIPLSARLMALADVFDALISPRVYKAALSYAQAREIILAGRGSHFDPDIVDAFQALYDDFVAIAMNDHDAAAAGET